MPVRYKSLGCFYFLKVFLVCVEKNIFVNRLISLKIQNPLKLFSTLPPSIKILVTTQVKACL
jgi:hypothetical protein